jgi:hypothetical protein
VIKNFVQVTVLLSCDLYADVEVVEAHVEQLLHAAGFFGITLEAL